MRYLKRGLECNQKVVMLDNYGGPEPAWAELRTMGVAVDDFIKSGQVAIFSLRTCTSLFCCNNSCNESFLQLSYMVADEFYLKGGNFDPERVQSEFKATVEAALAEGYSALRVIADVSSGRLLEEVQLFHTLARHEATVNTMLSQLKFIAACMYNCKAFKPDLLTSILQTHPYAVLDSSQNATENIYYMNPQQYLAPPEQIAHHVLEQMVKNIQRHEALISELSLRNQALEKALKQAEEATRAQSTFLTIAR